MPNLTLDQLTQEWRESVVKRLDTQDERLEDIREALTQLMLNTSTNAALGELEKRVRDLEKFQIRAVTTVAVTQVVIAIVWAIISRLLVK